MEDKTMFEKQFKEAKEFFDKKGFIIDDDKLKPILLAIKMKYPILLSGPTGSGKTMFLSLLAEFLKGEYLYQSLNGSLTIYDLTQERVPDKNGVFQTQDMILAKWLRTAQKKVSILHLDEVNAARPETLIAVHPLMDIKGELNLTFSDEILKVNDKAIIIMSCNEGDEYTGINALNAAFQNRFIKIHFPYIKKTELTELLIKKTGINKNNAEIITEIWANYISSKDEDQPPVSIRILERWATMSKYLGLKEAGINTFVSLIATTDEEKINFIEGDLFVRINDEED